MSQSGRATNAAPDSSSSPKHNDPFESTRMPFGDHLEELRSCLIRALVGIAVGAVISFLFAKDVLTIIFKPLIVVLNARGESPELLAMSPVAPFFLYLKTGFFCGLIITAPWVGTQIWRFIASGLYPQEQRFVRRLIPASSALFIAGVSFMYFIVLPLVVNFLISFNQSFDIPSITPNAFQQLLIGNASSDAPPTESHSGLQIPIVEGPPVDPPNGALWFNQNLGVLELQTADGIMSAPLRQADRNRAISARYGMKDYVTFVFSLMLGFGIAFQLPIVVYFLAATGLVTPDAMARSRRYVFFGIVIASAILTPPDVLSQLLMSVPMYGLFEVGLLIARRKAASTASPTP